MKTSYIILFFCISFLSACKHTDVTPAYVKVYKHDGSVQCEATAIDLNVMAKELINAGIDVICSQKGDTGLMYVTVCGGATGSINIYTIHKENLTDAIALKFESVEQLTEYRDQKCE